MWYYAKVFLFFFVIYCIKKRNINKSLHNCEEFLNEQALNFHLLCFLGGLRGASIIDSLDTLYIMELMDEYNDAKEWVKTSLDLNSVRKLFTPLPFFFICSIILCWMSFKHIVMQFPHSQHSLDHVDVIYQLIVVHIFTPLGSSPSLYSGLSHTLTFCLSGVQPHLYLCQC